MPRNNEDFYLQRMGQALGFPETPSFEKPRPSIRVLEQGGKAPIKINTDPTTTGPKVAATIRGGRLQSGFLGGGGLYGNMFKR